MEKGTCTYQIMSTGVFYAHEQFDIINNNEKIDISSNVTIFGKQKVTQKFNYLLDEKKNPKILDVKINVDGIILEIKWIFKSHSIEMKHYKNGIVEYENVTDYVEDNPVFLFQTAFVIPFYSFWDLNTIDLKLDKFHAYPFGNINVDQVVEECIEGNTHTNVRVNIIALDSVSNIELTYLNGKITECKYIEQDIIINITNEN